jgi:hypothetical protein
VRSTADKTADRARSYRRSIGELQAADRDRDGLVEALRWLRGEAVHAARLRPRDAAALYGRLTSQLAALASVLRQGQRAGRWRRDLGQLQAAGQHQEAFTGAVGWLAWAATAVARADPAAAPGMYRQLTDRVTTLAAAVPGYRPDRRHH